MEKYHDMKSFFNIFVENVMNFRVYDRIANRLAYCKIIGKRVPKCETIFFSLFRVSTVLDTIVYSD